MVPLFLLNSQQVLLVTMVVMVVNHLLIVMILQVGIKVESVVLVLTKTDLK